MASLELTQNTLKVTLHSKRLDIVTSEKKDNETIVRTQQVPLFDIDRVIVSGTPSISIPALCALMDSGIPVFFVSSHGKWRGSLLSDNNLNASRRILQYEKGTDPEFSVRVSKALIYAKIRNSRRVLQRLAANRSMTEDLEHNKTCDALLKYANAVLNENDSVDVIRGYEGMSSALYFKQLGRYFPEELPFNNRNRQPPKDPANALLSWTYTILLGEMEGVVRTHGLDAGIGNLHCDKINTPSLPLDLIEPLRPAIADLLVLNLVNHFRIKQEDHFEYSDEDGGVYLNSDGRRSFFLVYEQTMTRRFSVTKGGAHTDFRQVMKDTVWQYLRALERNEIPSFFQLP